MTPLTDTASPERERFFALLHTSLAQQAFVKLVLAKPRGAEPGLQRVDVRLIDLRGSPSLTFVYRHTTRDITKNLALAEGVVQVQALLGPQFRNANLFTHTDEVQLAFSKKGQGRLTSRAAAQPLAETGPTHNREKARWLDIERPFLVALGVTTAQHQLVPAMARKWKQIDKFIEVFAHALAASPLAHLQAATQPISVVDFGAGKGYLTFAVHEWLRHVKGLDAQVTGVELRPDMVALCNAVVGELGLQGLHFEQGDVRSYQPSNARPMDVMIALHACDVATDHAIHLGIRAGASVLMCSPCCHQQIRAQLLSPHPLRPMLQHGIHKDQQAEMVTDSLRALLLEAHGYDTQVFEFVSLEHTRMNKMILAVKRAQAGAAGEVLAQIEQIKQFYGIREQCLESLLQAGRLAA